MNHDEGQLKAAAKTVRLTTKEKRSLRAAIEAHMELYPLQLQKRKKQLKNILVA